MIPKNKTLLNLVAPIAVGLVFGGLIAFAPSGIAHIVDIVFWALLMGSASWHLRSTRRLHKQVKELLKAMEKDVKEREQKQLWTQISDINKVH